MIILQSPYALSHQIMMNSSIYHNVDVSVTDTTMMNITYKKRNSGINVKPQWQAVPTFKNSRCHENHQKDQFLWLLIQLNN